MPEIPEPKISKKPYVLLEILRSHKDGRQLLTYQVERETAGLRYKQEGDKVIKQVYNYVGWYQDLAIPYARILERFSQGKSAQKELQRFRAIAKVMNS